MKEKKSMFVKHKTAIFTVNYTRFMQCEVAETKFKENIHIISYNYVSYLQVSENRCGFFFYRGKNLTDFVENIHGTEMGIICDRMYNLQIRKQKKTIIRILNVLNS